ncbi:hypothetical protein EXIGLDRAFT_29460 [Exidia glandulosa HHB12029]|uniref:Uncharacterized protein n=1 Tax=Exidia glandulosa HHB12029 TaxID=1314781 RepID=A0A166BKC1_EXIGL|nr:hypothetical protein EXIGLDRAFT_29460 [Exidia glandulosa HHB12029]
MCPYDNDIMARCTLHVNLLPAKISNTRRGGNERLFPYVPDRFPRVSAPPIAAMDDNRVATPHEEQSIRAYLRTVEAARERQIADAQVETDRTYRDVVATEARMSEAEEAFNRAKNEHETAVAANARAAEFMAMACRPLSDDPLIRRQLGLIHPVRRLAPEVLGLIFETTVWTVFRGNAIMHSFGAEHLVGSQQLPYRLSMVCRRWREVALRTPRLWRLICVELSDVTPLTISQYEMYLQTSFERSAKRGIMLRVHARRLRERHYSVEQNAVLNTVGAMLKADGIENLFITPMKEDLFDAVNPSTNLLKLNVDSRGDAALALVHRLPTVAPNLRQITLSIRLLAARLHVPHPTVERVKLVGSCIRPHRLDWHTHPLKNLFAFFPAAWEIDLSLASGYGTVDHLRHDTLQILHLDSLSSIDRLADRYTFPRLRELHVGVQRGVRDTEDDPILHLLGSGACANVTKLAFHCAVELGERFLIALRKMPRLESLLSSHGVPSAEFAAGLAAPEADGTWVCPRLAELRMGSVREDAIAEEITNLVMKRREAHVDGEPVADLDTVHVWCRGISKGVERRLHREINRYEIDLMGLDWF